MAKRKTSKAKTKPTKTNKSPPNQNIKVVTFDDVLRASMTEYGTYVLEERAIPALEDGLKPVQRRILWAMHSNLNSTPHKNFLKSARVVGAAFQYHPHSGTYGTLVNMVEGIACPLIEGHGNFGGPSSEEDPGAERYTEARISKFTQECVFNPRFKGAYYTIPNFDNSAVEPVTLPCQIPLVLALGSSGIAMGATTQIPSFTVESLYTATQLSLKSKKPLTPKKLLKVLEWSSPYGGKIISTDKEKLAVLKTGQGPLNWECDYTVDLKSRTLTITGISPHWNYDKQQIRLADSPNVLSVQDMSDGNGIKIVVTLKKCTDSEAKTRLDSIINSNTLLRSRVSYRCNVVSRKYVKDELLDTSESKFSSMSIPDTLFAWTQYRIGVEKRALTLERKGLRGQVAKIDLMLLAVANLALIFKLLKTKKIDKVKVLATKLKITEEASKEIWGISVGRLDQLSANELTVKKKSLVKRSKEITALLKTPRKAVLLDLQKAKPNLF